MKQVIETIPYKDRNGGFAVSIPDKPTKKAIIDLHGLGEKTNAQPSSSIEYVKSQVRDKLIARTGLPYLISKGFEIDFLVISPQMWGDGWWDANFVKAVYEHCKERYGFEYCFGHGISAGGRGIEGYAESYPNDLIATVGNAGARSSNPGNRKNSPHWELCCSGDTVVNAKSNGLAYVSALNKAGGKGYYTYFKGQGHHAGFWNNTLNGNITASQLDEGEGKKEYIPSNFPIGDWFDTFIAEMAEPEPKPKPLPNEEGIIKPISVQSNYVTNAESIFDVEAGYEKIIDYKSTFGNDYSSVKREIIADFGSDVTLTKVAWLDMHGNGEWKLFASSDKNDWELLLTDNLSTFKKWHSKGVNVSARYIKIETYGHQLPVRVAFIGYGGEYIPEKRYTVVIEDLSENEKESLLKEYEGRVSIKEF